MSLAPITAIDFSATCFLIGANDFSHHYVLTCKTEMGAFVPTGGSTIYPSRLNITMLSCVHGFLYYYNIFRIAIVSSSVKMIKLKKICKKLIFMFDFCIFVNFHRFSEHISETGKPTASRFFLEYRE